MNGGGMVAQGFAPLPHSKKIQGVNAEPTTCGLMGRSKVLGGRIHPTSKHSRRPLLNTNNKYGGLQIYAPVCFLTVEAFPLSTVFSYM